MTEVLVALVSVLGVAVPLFFGESRQIKNLRARIELVRDMPEELGDAKANLIASINAETYSVKVTRTRGSLVGSIVALGALAISANLFINPDVFLPHANPSAVKSIAATIGFVAYFSLGFLVSSPLSRLFRHNRSLDRQA